MKHLKWIILFLTLSIYSQTPGNGLIDIDGNSYNTVVIGTQEWMKENLNVSKYSDGTIIPQVTDPTAWTNLNTGAWCYYNNDPAKGAVYGKLYNWYAAAGIYNAASLTNPTLRKKLAPMGWHVPTDTEWTTLTDCLGGGSVAGSKMKATGTSLWSSPNTDATNSSGFTGLPGGYRDYDGPFNNVGSSGYWWSSSESGTTYAWCRSLGYNYGNAYRSSTDRTIGFSVRCLRDSSLSNSTFNSSNLKLYPNPVVSILNVKTDFNLINQPYSIIDGLGRVVLNGKLNEVDTAINVEQLSKGIYYLKILGNSATKFIKE